MDWEPADGEEALEEKGPRKKRDGADDAGYVKVGTEFSQWDTRADEAYEAYDEADDATYISASMTSDSPDDVGNTKGQVIALLILMLMLMIPFGLLGFSTCSRHNETFSWPTTGLAVLLPEPSSTYGELREDSWDRFSVYVYKYSQEDFDAYVASCKELGYTVDYSSTSTRYWAYSEDGYYLQLSYDESDKEMSITLDAPDEGSVVDYVRETIDELQDLVD